MKDNKLNKKLNMPHAMLSLILTLVMYLIFLKVNQITPFGKNTWLVYEMKRQYVDYCAYFRSIITGECNPFYSFSTTLGSGTIGFFTYYLTSPFLLITAFFPNNELPLALSIVIGLKIIFSAFTMDIFIQKFCGKGSYLCAVTYGFCGFVIANAMNIMWLDVIIMLPIVMLMTETLINDGKVIGYVISVAVILILNYYMAYMVLIFVLLWTLLRMWNTKEKNPSLILYRLGIATVLSAGVDTVLLIPTFLELKNNALLAASDSEEVITVVNELNLRQVISKLFSLSFNSAEIYWGAPMIFCGIAILIFAILFFFNIAISWKERLSMFAILLAFMLSFVIERLNLLWHVGVEHTDFPYREAILCVFVIITCAAKCMVNLREGISKKRYIAAVICIFIFAVYALTTPELCLDGWKLILNYAILILTIALVGIMLLAQSKSVNMIAATLLVLIQFFDLGLNATYIYRTESVKVEKVDEYERVVVVNEEAVKAVKELDSSFYRMDNWSQREQNDSMLYAYNGVTNYSIASLTYVRDFLQKLGYDDDETYLDYGHDNTETADSLLGIKYVLTDSAHALRMHREYELVVDKKVQAYKNPYALSVGMGVYREMSGESMDPFSLQEDIYSRLAGEMISIFVPANVESSYELGSRPEVEYRVTASKDGEMYFYMTDLIDNFDNMEVYINDEFYTYYGNDSCLKVLNLGYMQAGEVMYVDIKADDEDEFGTALFVSEDTEALSYAYNKVKDRQATIERISSSHIRMTLDSAYTVGDEISGQVGVFTTIPYEKGWMIKVAGTRVKPIEVYDSLMYIPVTEAIQQVELEPGENLVIDMIYVPDGLVIGLIFSVVTIIIMIMVATLRKSEAGYFIYEDEDEEEIK